MTNPSNKADNGVSIGIPEGYTYEQIIRLAGAIYTQFFSEHERYCYSVSKDRKALTVFPVN